MIAPGVDSQRDFLRMLRIRRYANSRINFLAEQRTSKGVSVFVKGLRKLRKIMDNG